MKIILYTQHSLMKFMKFSRFPTFSAIVVMLVSVSLTGCNNSATNLQPSQPESSTSAAKPATAQVGADKPADTNNLANLKPEVGVIQNIQQGDIMCYITFKDEAGAERTVGAIFELCENPQQFINQRMRLVYGIETVNDCTSAEPCGKTRQAQVVIQMQPVDGAARPADSNLQVLTNGEWKITIGNRDSWSGVNGTGELTYRGCNSQQECIDLTGGKVTCRDGICSTSWVNGDYSYNLRSPMTDGTGASDSKLIVSRNGDVLQEITGLK